MSPGFRDIEGAIDRTERIWKRCYGHVARQMQEHGTLTVPHFSQHCKLFVLTCTYKQTHSKEFCHFHNQSPRNISF